ncbi:MAG: hypothetical protein JWN04_3049, partial [Myxococcaceae bacterium]|nr:hypothetical protein [Myxococcaceae bacterium]
MARLFARKMESLSTQAVRFAHPSGRLLLPRQRSLSSHL